MHLVGTRLEFTTVCGTAGDRQALSAHAQAHPYEYAHTYSIRLLLSNEGTSGHLIAAATNGDYCHKEIKVIHRDITWRPGDIKPDNIMINHKQGN